MASIQFKPLSALQPIELRYEYSVEEKLNSELVSYTEGLNFYKLDGLQNYQDSSINKGSCLVLTSAVSLSSFFKPQDLHKIGSLPGTVLLQERGNTISYLRYDSTNNKVILDTTASKIFINPITGTSEVELLIDGKYLQVDVDYPFQVRASNTPLKGDEAYRQRFILDPVDQDLTINTRTLEGRRYLALSRDSETLNTLFAIGCILGNTTLNDYVFNLTPVTTTTIEHGHIPNNAWVTYFMDLQNETENKSVSANKTISDTAINYLVDFPYQAAIETGKATINVANLKTDFTSTGGPAPVDNTYNTTPITTN
jgi:hypothetical protein